MITYYRWKNCTFVAEGEGDAATVIKVTPIQEHNDVFYGKTIGFIRAFFCIDLQKEEDEETWKSS